MAKRGYRGKHPYNDAKVSPNPDPSKYSSKLKKEYNKLKTKLKYDYIRTHYFYPQATATLTVVDTVANAKTVTLISTDGTSKAYTSNSTADLANNVFDRDTGGVSGIAASLVAAINHANGHGGKILASNAEGVITLTQVEPGPDGNTTVTKTIVDGDMTATNFTGG